MGVKGMLENAMMRTALAIEDVGEVFVAAFDASNGAVATKSGDDILVKVRNLLTGILHTPRLFVPLNILWRLPKKDDTCTVVRPTDTDGPGAAYALFGDGSTAAPPPSWLDANTSGISAPESLILESTGGDTTLRAAGGHLVKLGAGTEPVIKGTTFQSAQTTLDLAFTTFLIALNAYVVAIQPVADTAGTVSATLETAITAMKTALSAFGSGVTSSLSTTVKTS